MNKIKELRNEINIKQEVLAKLLNLEIAGVSKLETGRVPLKDDYILKLANFFDVSTDYLLGLSNIRNPEKQIQQTSNNSEILMYYNQLNDLGKEKATDNVKDLTKIPEYTEKRDKSQNA